MLGISFACFFHQIHLYFLNQTWPSSAKPLFCLQTPFQVLPWRSVSSEFPTTLPNAHTEEPGASRKTMAFAVFKLSQPSRLQDGAVLGGRPRLQRSDKGGCPSSSSR